MPLRAESGTCEKSPVAERRSEGGTSLARIVLKNTFVQILGKGAVTFLRMLANVLLARYLLVEGFGEYSLLFVVVGLVEALVEFGSTNFSAGEIVKDWENRNGFLSNLMALKVMLAGAAMVITLILARFMGYSHQLTMALYLSTAVYFFFVFTSTGLVLFQANLKMEYSALANSLDAAIFFAFVIGVIHWHGNLVHLVTGLIAAKAVNTGITYYLVKKWTRPRLRFFNFFELKNLFKKILPVGVSLLMVILYNNIDILMLSKMSGIEAVGIYGAAYKFVYLLPTVSAMLMASIYPLMVQSWKDDRDHMKLIFQKAFDYTVILAVFTFLILFFTADSIINILFGSAFQRSVIVLQILGGGMAFMLLTSIVGPCYIIVDKQDRAMLLTILGVGLNVTLNLILIPRFSYTGAAAATVITEFSLLIPGTYLLMKYFQFALSMTVTGKALVAGLLCGILFEVVHFDNSLLLLPIGVPFYFGILYLMGAIPRVDLQALKVKASYTHGGE